MKPFIHINQSHVKLDDNGHPVPTQQFIAFFHFVSFRCISLGLSLNLWPLHIEIHLPFGFIRIGMTRHYPYPSSNEAAVRKRAIGLQERWPNYI